MLSKVLLSMLPVLTYTDYALPFTVNTDASINGIGAILYQTKDNKRKPVVV